MKTRPGAIKPAIRGKWIAGFLLGDFIRNKTLYFLLVCIFSSVPQARAVEVTSATFGVELIEFMQGGGPTTSSNINSLYTAIGGSVITVDMSSSSNFNLWAGFLHLLLQLGGEELPPEGTLIADLACREDVLGALIPSAAWQKDTSPYFYWTILTKPESLLTGFSISLDDVPDEKLDITSPHHQYPEQGVNSGKHTFYVLPFTSGSGWDRSSQLSFEIWVDAESPIVNQMSPGPGAIVGKGGVSISCSADDALSGLDLEETKLALNGSSVAFTYDKASKLLQYKGASGLLEGINTVLLKAYDLVGNYVAKGWDFIADTVPPAGSIMINNGEKVTHSAYVSLNIEAKDVTTGIKSMVISNDGIFDTEMSEGIGYNTLVSGWLLSFPDTDGPKNVYVKFEDLSGNISQAYSASIDLKRLTPDTNIISGPAALTEESSALFKYEGSKSDCVFSFKLDNLDWSDWSSSQEASFSALSDGNHYFYVKAAYDLNQDGGITLDEEDATPASWVWTIGKTEAEKLEEKILFWRR